MTVSMYNGSDAINKSDEATVWANSTLLISSLSDSDDNWYDESVING